MEEWPEGVPYKVQRSTFRQSAPYRAPHRTEFEDGNRRARRSSTKNIATIQFTFVDWSKDEFEAFALWVRNTLVDGTLPFTMPVWTQTADEYAERVCSMVSGEYTTSDVPPDRTAVSWTIDVVDYTRAT
jgi:hypothetical protein